MEAASKQRDGLVKGRLRLCLKTLSAYPNDALGFGFFTVRYVLSSDTCPLLHIYLLLELSISYLLLLNTYLLLNAYY